MHIRVLAVGDRQPAWVSAAVAEYRVRLPRNWQFSLREISAASRSGRNRESARVAEGDAILAGLGDRERLIALDEGGRQLTSAGLADWIDSWQQDGRDVCLAIGGADGLAERCLERAESRWSLSRLTLPHGLVRVLLVEQLYRAWSLNSGHPYHRG